MCAPTSQERRVQIRGHYRLVNKHDAPIGQLHVVMNPRAQLCVTAPADARLVTKDAQSGYRIYQLAQPLAQYSALMVMEKEYGREHMPRFLKYELDEYLRGRGGELIEEMPLMRDEDQRYIHSRRARWCSIGCARRSVKRISTARLQISSATKLPVGVNSAFRISALDPPQMSLFAYALDMDLVDLLDHDILEW
jgi:hypothetical protein